LGSVGGLASDFPPRRVPAREEEVRTKNKPRLKIKQAKFFSIEKKILN
jgi:hypothetical protein